MTLAVLLDSVGFGYNEQPHRIIDRVSLAVDTGEAVAIRGPNGSGKSTLLSIIAGELQPDEGTVDIESAHRTYLHTDWAMFEDLTVGENIEFIRGVGPDRFLRPERVEFYGFPELTSTAFANLSVGQRKRFGLMCCLDRPGLAVLDEPFSGLDEHWFELVKSDIARHLAEPSSCLILATHRSVAELEGMATSVNEVHL